MSRAPQYLMAEKVTGPPIHPPPCGLEAGEDKWHEEASMVRYSGLSSSGSGRGLFSGSTLKWF